MLKQYCNIGHYHSLVHSSLVEVHSLVHSLVGIIYSSIYIIHIINRIYLLE